jgi:hypothetical protein
MKNNVLPFLLVLFLTPSLCLSEGLLRYNPPSTGAPTTLTGGGTRGFGAKPLQVLAPRHVALTSQAQPVLYWYYSLSKQQKVQITITKEGSKQPLLQKQLDEQASAGLQSINLEAYGVTLEPGVQYRWSVALNDAEQHSGDAIPNETAATLRYQMPDSPLAGVEQQAAAGYWYDALRQLIESRSPRTNQLLEQAGLKIPVL